jgi:metal transporter CNNM
MSEVMMSSLSGSPSALPACIAAVIDEGTKPIDPMSLIIVILLICLSATFSGLTLGLMGLDLNGLEIVIEGGDEQERKNASKIFTIRKHGNLLLCTLLLGNVGVNAGISILMADMTSGLVGFLVSTVAIVIFGEIIPQATCSRYPLAIGAFTVPFMKVLMVLMWPLTAPVSKALDCMLGSEIGTIYNKQEMRKLIKLHQANMAHSNLTEHEG